MGIDAKPTRRELLALGGTAGAAGAAAGVTGLAAVGVTGLAAATARADPPPLSASAALARIVSLEALLVFSYQAPPAAVSPPIRNLAAELVGQERAHLAAWRSLARGTGAASTPALGEAAAADGLAGSLHVQARPWHATGDKDWLYDMLSIENVILGAYYAAIGAFSDPDHLRLAGQVMGSEAQHQVLVALVVNKGDPNYSVPQPLVQGTK